MQRPLRIPLSRRQIIVISLAIIILAIPYVGLLVFGSYALWERGWFWYYGLLTTLITTACFLALKRVREQMRQQSLADWRTVPTTDWAVREQAAWQKIEAIARQAETGEIQLRSYEDLQDLVVRLIKTVAEHFHPDDPDAYLKVPVTDVLKILENVARELRELTQSYVPGSHVLTIRDWLRLRELWQTSQLISNIYRVVMLGLSPASTIWREIQRYVMGQSLKMSVDDFTREMLAFFIRRMGYHLIELYSGRVILDPQAFTALREEKERQEWSQAQEVPQTPAEKPSQVVRVVFMGQVKAGKSSLINALCGSWAATTDVLPCTSETICYRLTPSRQNDPADSESATRAELPGGLLLVDTPGYEVGTLNKLLKTLEQEWEQADMICLVCAANSAARLADRDVVKHLRSFFDKRPHLKPPPLIVVCSFIDKLRPFQEWAPPYRWNVPELPSDARPKERSIWECLRVIRRDLQLTEDHPVIPVCGHPERVYNIREALVPMINRLWDEAYGVRRNRLVHHRPKKSVSLVGQQLVNAVKLGLDYGAKKIRKNFSG